MTKTVETTVEAKLRALYDLQLIDSKIDEIRNVRGELPLEVRDLEDDVAGLDARIQKFEKELAEIDQDIKDFKTAIDSHHDLIKKYIGQQKNVRNNREFDSLSKEIEFQELEIQLAEKKIKQSKASSEFKKEQIEKVKTEYNQKKSHLEFKKSELDNIMAETQNEEDFLIKKSEEFAENIDERLLNAYKRIRNSVRNGLAVVSIERGAANGSFFTIPPQTQVEIAARKKIITDEHSGRILVDHVLATEEKEKMEKLFNKMS